LERLRRKHATIKIIRNEKALKKKKHHDYRELREESATKMKSKDE